MAGGHMRKTPDDTGTYTGELILKRSGFAPDESSSRQELYLRLSMGDFPIRCCGGGDLRGRLEERVGDFVRVKGEMNLNDPDWVEGCLRVTDLLD